eukprot:m.115502 g.115502  ORF g.115502 m.115502 type:complete len:53 (-) comp28427_c0_seq1:969-1127(-)
MSFESTNIEFAISISIDAAGLARSYLGRPTPVDYGEHLSDTSRLAELGYVER